MITYIIEIEIQSKSWDYFIGQIIMIPIKGVNKLDAEERFSDNYCGSEYPMYKIRKIHEIDTFIFSPTRFKKFIFSKKIKKK
jgi:hypothetical protein